MNFIQLNTETALTDTIQSINREDKLIICRGTEEKERLKESFEFDKREPSEIIFSSLKINPEKLFYKRKKEVQENYTDELTELEGEWSEEHVKEQGFFLTMDFSSGEPLHKITGATITTDESWKIPAFLKYGNWNECPKPEIHCVIWKYWQEKYDAHIIGVSGDIIQAVVKRPPTSQEDSMELAWQQYLYCADIVDQGTESIANLASTLINSEYWYFWWD